MAQRHLQSFDRGFLPWKCVFPRNGRRALRRCYCTREGYKAWPWQPCTTIDHNYAWHSTSMYEKSQSSWVLSCKRWHRVPTTILTTAVWRQNGGGRELQVYWLRACQQWIARQAYWEINRKDKTVACIEQTFPAWLLNPCENSSLSWRLTHCVCQFCVAGDCIEVKAKLANMMERVCVGMVRLVLDFPRNPKSTALRLTAGCPTLRIARGGVGESFWEEVKWAAAPLTGEAYFW